MNDPPLITPLMRQRALLCDHRRCGAPQLRQLAFGSVSCTAGFLYTEGDLSRLAMTAGCSQGFFDHSHITRRRGSLESSAASLHGELRALLALELI